MTSGRRAGMTRRAAAAATAESPALAGRGADESAVAHWCQHLPTLVGERVVLRDLQLSDAPALVRALNGADVRRFIAAPPENVEAFENFILWAQCERSRGRYACFAVVPKGMDTAIGVFQIRQIDAAFASAEWGFAIGSDYWGAGYFSDAARQVIDFAFNTIGVRRLEARSAVANLRANGALRKLGAVKEGVLRRAFRKDGVAIDAALWSILADEWRRLRTVKRPARVH